MPGGSQYLQTSELPDFDLPATVTVASIRSASSLLDAYLGRPEGLVWVPDAAGTPAYMAAPNSRLTLACPSGASPGSGVRVPVTGAVLNNNSIGEAVVFDRTNANLTEVCVVVAVEPGFITLDTVLYTHAAASKLDFGLTIKEERELPNDRSITRVAKHPVLRLLSGAGRYGYGRRSQQMAGNFQEFNLLTVVSSFGGPPLWIPWSVTNASVSFETGEIWVPAGVLLAYFTDVRVWYVAGYPSDEIPYPVKRATANIALNMKETGLGANIRSRNVRDGTVVSKFENNIIDANTREMIAPYLARRFV